MDEIELIPVDGHNSLGRDPQSNAILNTDMSGYEAYKKARQDALRKDRDLEVLRNEVNELNEVLSDAFSLLGVGGKLAVISYHSTEDKLVKNFINNGLSDCVCPPLNFECNCNISPYLKLINKKPLVPTLEEINQNPRSRSAKLRVIERIK